MDPVSQGALGAAAALAVWAKDERLSPGTVATLGALSAMAPDLDVLIRSSQDPLLAIKYHRHFTHSLLFVPVGAALALLPWLLLSRIRRHITLAYQVSALGYLTHAPLDCCTTYGTLWFWPFSDYRVALSWISVVDPVFTIPLLGWIIAALIRKKRWLAGAGLALSLSYIALGALQKSRAVHVQQLLLERRNHQAARHEVLTTFMNQVTWRSLYERNGRIFFDEVRVPYVGSACIKEGGSLPLAPGPPAEAGPEVRRAHRLMRWFSKGWVAPDPKNPKLLGDARYSFHPWGARPFWGITTNVAQDEVAWVNTRIERKIDISAVFRLIFQTPDGAICLD